MSGLAPLAKPVAGAAIEDRLREERDDRGNSRSEAPRGRVNCSDALKCSRQIAFKTLGLPRDIELTPEAMLTFRAGDFFHQVVQEALVRTFDARLEVPVDWSPELSLSGYGDAVYNKESPVTAVEIKSMAGYGFLLATGGRKSREGPGPKADHLTQAGLFALAPQIAAERVHIIYVSKDTCRVAEWIIGVDDELDHLGGQTVRQMVEAEKVRLAGILSRLDDGTVPKRYVPGHGVVVDPTTPKDAPVDPAPWNCGYCAWQPTCAGLERGPVPVSLVMPEREEVPA